MPQISRTHIICVNRSSPYFLLSIQYIFCLPLSDSPSTCLCPGSLSLSLSLPPSLYQRRNLHAYKVLPERSDPAVLPHPCRAVRGSEGRVKALYGQELRRFQRDLLAAGLSEHRRRGPDAGRPQEKVHEDFRGEAVVAGADGERRDDERDT